MPITKKDQAKEGGFQQVRNALQEFVGDVTDAKFAEWGPSQFSERRREYLEVSCTNLQIVKTSEELSFIPTVFSFRVNCSDYVGSFWVDNFLDAADKAQLLIPDDLVGKRIRWVKAKKVYEIKGEEVIVENFVIGSIVEEERVATPPQSTDEDLLAVAADLAVGKTEAQFRSALSVNPLFTGSPLLALAKSGLLAGALVQQGVLTQETKGNQTIYVKV